jgi:hypothetical protein
MGGRNGELKMGLEGYGREMGGFEALGGIPQSQE